jgi:hypothetical protein
MEPQRTKGTARTNLESGRALARFGLSCVPGGTNFNLANCPRANAIALRHTRKIFRTPQHFVSFSPVIITSLLLLICWLLPCTTSSAASDDRLCHRPPGTANAFDSTHMHTRTQRHRACRHGWWIGRRQQRTLAAWHVVAMDHARSENDRVGIHPCACHGHTGH